MQSRLDQSSPAESPTMVYRAFKAAIMTALEALGIIRGCGFHLQASVHFGACRVKGLGHPRIVQVHLTVASRGLTIPQTLLLYCELHTSDQHPKPGGDTTWTLHTELCSNQDAIWRCFECLAPSSLLWSSFSPPSSFWRRPASRPVWQASLVN